MHDFVDANTWSSACFIVVQVVTGDPLTMLWTELKTTTLLLLLLCSRCWCCTGTDITWHANVEDAGTNDPAKTAPKSQRYWDENNIEKPDYAYTDAEYRAMKNVGNVSVISGGFVGPAVVVCFVLGMVAGLYVLYTARSTGGGGPAGIGGPSWQTSSQRLGSGDPSEIGGSDGSNPIDAFLRWLRSAMNPPPFDNRSSGSDMDAQEQARQARLARFHPVAPATAEDAEKED
jgi:hypothetical protein